MNATLGRLEKVDLRNIWESEATDFTPWLAREENLALLSEVIGLDLELEAQEKNVGPFRADILCKDTASDNWVLIENQLEKTDHTHLGQLLTYAAGLKAVTIVWISQRFTEEHRSALDWLNSITDDRFNFFGLEVELWRIANSPVAPKFNVISKPNNWSKTVAQGVRKIGQEETTGVRQIYFQFWSQLEEYILQSRATFRMMKPMAQQWANVTLGKAGFMLCPVLKAGSGEIRIDFYINHAQSKAYFHALHHEKEAIERELGQSLEWRLLPDKKASKIELHQYQFEPSNQSQWPEMNAWFLENISKMRDIFAPRIKVINPDLWVNLVEPDESIEY